jgi:hypothetical protein
MVTFLVLEFAEIILHLLLMFNYLGHRGGVAEDIRKSGRVAGIITIVIFVILVSF